MRDPRVQKKSSRRSGYTPAAPAGTRYEVHTAAGTFTVEETGQHWTPGERLPERQPNPLLALARSAEVAAQKGIYAPGVEERRAA
jgi:hypothetical protein